VVYEFYLKQALLWFDSLVCNRSLNGDLLFLLGLPA
jgi:hypothetical protein